MEFVDLAVAFEGDIKDGVSVFGAVDVSVGVTFVVDLDGVPLASKLSFNSVEEGPVSVLFSVE